MKKKKRKGKKENEDYSQNLYFLLIFNINYLFLKNNFKSNNFYFIIIIIDFLKIKNEYSILITLSNLNLIL